MRPAKLIYQRTDRYETYPGVDADEIRGLDEFMKLRADATLFCSSYVYQQERDDCRRAVLVDHGVDFERFATAGMRGRTAIESAAAGDDPARIGRPRVGFVGGIDAHTFDPVLFNEVVRALPDVHFVLVGACSLPDGWCLESNVTMAGRQPYERVAEYMAACDVLIMPWNSSDWIRACNPVKLKEYLAVGRPVVSTPFEELQRYEGFVRVAKDSRQFAQHIREVLADPPDPRLLRERVRRETWAAKGQTVLEALAEPAADRDAPNALQRGARTRRQWHPGKTAADQGAPY